MLFSDIRQPHSVWLLMIFECRNVKNNRYFVLIFLYFNVMLKLCLSICMKIVLHITVIMKALHKCINHYNWMDKNSFKKMIFVECLWHISCRSEKIRMNDLGVNQTIRICSGRDLQLIKVIATFIDFNHIKLLHLWR